MANEPGRAGGTVYVYHREGADWPLEQTLSRERGEIGPLTVFGNRIDLSGERLVAAAPARVYDGRGLVAAFVYVRSAGGVWTQ